MSNCKIKDREFKTIGNCGLLLLLATSWAYCDQRATTALTENWHIKQLDTDKPDFAAFTRSAASPDRAWLSAQMPAQVHEILLRYGKISDPHVGKNAAEFGYQTLFLPDALRRDQQADARKIFRAHDHPAGSTASSNAVNLIWRIDIGSIIWHLGIEVSASPNLLAIAPIPPLGRDADLTHDVLVQDSLGVCRRTLA